MGAECVKAAKVQTLKTEFKFLSMKETNEPEDFCLKLYGIVTNIHILGESVEESNVVKKLLRVVLSKFLQIVKMTVEEVMGRLKSQEERLRGQNENTSNSSY